MTKKTFLAIKYCLTAVLLLFCITGLYAQSGTYKNTTGVSGSASLGAQPVSDISFTNYQFPMIGIALAASQPSLQYDGSYNITYTYTIKNYGGISLTQVQVNTDLTTTFASPMTFTVQSRNFSGISGNNAFTASGSNAQLLSSTATLAPGATATVTVVINLKSNGQYGTFNAAVNAIATAGTGTITDASVKGTNPDANNNGVPMDDSSPTPVTISRPDIEVKKTVSNTTPYVGDNVVFTIAVNNKGAGDAVNTQITELPDNGFALITATPSVGTYDAATKIWTIGRFNAGASATLTCTMEVKAAGPYSNKAFSSHPADNNPANDRDSVTLLPKPSSDVQIKKTVSNTNPDVLSTVQYTLSAINKGPSDADNVVVTDTLPSGIEPVAPLPAGMTYDPSQRKFTWNLGTMPVDIEQTKIINTQVQADIDRSNFTNKASITTTDYDPKLNNNTSIVTIVPKEAVDLSITKEVVTTTNPIYPLDPVTFVIKVRNLGPNNCYDANVTDLLTSGYTFSSATATQGTYTAGSGLWKIGTLLKDQEVILTIKAVFTATVNYGNTATTSTTDNDNNPDNNSASIPLPPVRPRTDLQVTITPSTSTPDAGDNITFTVTVKNNGPSPSTGVVLDNVILPNGYSFVSKDQAGYNQAIGVWSIGNLAMNGTATLKLVGTILPNASEYNVNAHVSGNEDETRLDNNSAITNLTVSQVADIVVTKTVDNTKPEVGQKVNFTITVKNNGPSIANNVVVTEDNPGGYQFNTITPSAGIYNNGTWTIGTLNSGETRTLVINATVLPDGNYTNTVSATLTEKDKVTNNNTATVTPTVTQLADLSLTKTINNSTPDAGSTVQFTLTAKNNGPGKATGVKVSDALPTGYTFVSATPSGVYNSTTGTWTINNLAKDQTTSLVISATVKATGNYTNSAAVTGNEKDPDTDNNSASVTPVVRPVADLQIVKSVNKNPADAGSDVVFTLKATNKGVSGATNVVVNDVLPDGFTFKSASPSGQYNQNTGVWTVGTLGVNVTKTLTITATVKTSGNYVNTAIIKGTEYDPVTNNDTSRVTLTRTQVADLAINKQIDNSTPDVGSTVTFTVTASNLGVSDATGVVVTDALPTGYALVQAQTATGSVTGNSWTIGNMSAGATATLTIKATVNATGIYKNTATIAGNEADRNTTNNSSEVTPVPIPVANLKVEKTVDKSTVNAGDEVIFNVKVTNNGPSTAANVVLTDLLNSGYSYVSHTKTGGSGSYNTVTGVWSAGNLTNGQILTLSIIAKAKASGDYNNTATVKSDTKDLDLTDNSASVTPPTVNPAADLSISKTVDNSTADAGSQVVFTLTATNNGPSTATVVAVGDLLPTGFTFVSATPSAAYDATTGKWTIGTLASSASQTLAVTATVNPEGVYTNTATISGTEYDPVTTNNTSSVTVTRTPVADLEVTKSVDQTTPDVGANIVFTIKAINHGGSKATGVTVTDVLQNGYSLVSATASSGTYSSGTWTIGDLEKDADATLTITAKVLATGLYSNNATITGNEVDRNTTNNSSSVTPVPVPVANLSVVKTISNSTPDVGRQVTFTITATNAGPSEATSVVVTDVLQSGYELIQASNGYNATNGTWTIGTMTSGQTATLTITAKVLPIGTYTNTATISSPVKDTDPTDNTSTITTPVVRAVADLSIVKAVDNSTADAGSQVVFTLTATNNGPSTATVVVVSDLLPTGFTFVSATPSAAYDATTGKWTIGTLASGASQVLTVTATVNPEGVYTNTATISGTEHDPVTTNNTSSVTVTRTAVADLEVTKSVDQTTPDVGANVVFTINAVNHGASKATGVAVTDLLQSGYSLVSATASSGTYSSGTWTIGDLEKDADATLTVTAKVLATGDYSNTATITGNETDRNTTNNSSSVTPVPVPVANLSVVKTISNSTPDVGSQVTFTITATNAGPSEATSVVVTDVLQSGYELVQATTATSSYDATNGTWTIGAMTSGQTATLTITAKVLPIGTYTNTATISSPVKDTDPTDNTSTITTPVVRAVADLSIVKAVDNSTADAGSQVVFTLTATNNGPSTATVVAVSDLLPTGFTFVSATPSASYDATTGKWTIGTLASGASQTLAVTATVNPEGVYTNTATISGTEYDPVTTNNTSSVTVTRTAVTDLGVTKSVDNSTPDVGSNVVFTIKAINHGESKATGVTVTDLLQSGYSLVSATASSGTYSSGTWTIGDLEKDADATLTITAKVLATGDYSNTATITGNETDRNTTNNSSSVTPVPVPVANLSVVKTISNSTPDVGSQVTFTITATNAGPSEATSVVVTDVLQSGYELIQASNGYNATNGTWAIGTMTSGQTATLTITAKVLPTGIYTNTATISSPVKDTDPTDNTSTITTPVVRAVADLSIVKAVDNSTADAGSQVVFTLTATNNGPSTATVVAVSDLLPTGFTFVSATPSAAYDATTGKWTIGTLASGASQTLTVTATVNPEGVYTNTATISGTEHDPVTTNNTSSVTVTRTPVADLEVTKSVNNTTPDVGSNVVFTIKAINHGASKATGVTVTDLLQNGYSLVSATASSGTYSSGTWTIGDLEKDADATLTITAKVLATGDYSNTATITGNETDRNTTNNSSSVTPVPVPVANLSVVKTISNSTPDVGSQVTFTITATNAGPSDATSVVVTDVLQSGYELVQATTATSSYDATNGTWTIGTMTSGQTATLTITAKVLPIGTYTNTATISSPVKDTDPTDNTSTITTPVVRAVADLSIVKAVDNSTADAGSQVVFTLTATNNGPSTATVVAVSDLLPTGFTFVSATPSAAYDATTGKWTIGTLASGASQTLAVTATVNPEGIYTNIATISGTEHDPVTTNNTSSVTVTRTPVADLEVTKSVNNTTPDVGSNVVFTIKAINHGASKATGVTVTDLLQNGYSLVSATASSGTYSSGTWTIGDLEKDADATLTITAKVLATGDYSNTATITGNEIDRNTTNNSSSLTPVPVPVANLSVVKTISNSTPDVGSQVTFTITATNAGPSEATSVVVTDVLQSGYELVQASNGYNATSGTWNIGTLASGQKATLTITAKVLPMGNYNNTTKISSPVKDTDPTDNTSTITTPVVRAMADLSVVKTVDNSITDAGSKVVFTLTATNSGPSPATGVVVSDLLPTGYTFLSAVPATAYEVTTGKWTIGTLANGAGSTLKITAIVNAEGNYTNTATIGGTEYDPITTNNISNVTVTRTPVADLEVTKSVDNNTPDIGTNVIFTIKAVNHGASKATGVKVLDVLQDGYSLVNATPSAGTYSGGTWTIGGLEKDASATLTITAKVLATGVYSNTATISGNEIDRNPANNSSSVTPVPVPLANLSVVKTISNSTPDIGSQVTFTITASNAGPGDATGVIVTDVLKSGYQFLNATPSAGTYNAGTGIWTIGKLNNNQQVKLVINAQVLPTGDYTNTAVIKGNEKDKTPADNSSSITPPVPVQIADLQVVKTVSNNTPGTGSIVSFKVVVKNNGPSTATNIVVTDLMQSGFTFQQSDVDKGSYVSATGTWTIGTLNAGATASLQVDAWVNTTGIYTNTATVTGREKDPDNSNNTSKVTVQPDPVVDLSVSKSVSNMAPINGTDVTFTIVAGNKGPSEGTGVTVTDILPGGYKLKSAVVTTGSYNEASGIWTIGRLGKNAVAKLTVVATVNKTGDYTNTAVIKGNETDANPADNRSSVKPIPVALHTNDDAASTEEPVPVTINIVKNDVYGNTGHTVVIKDKPLHGKVVNNGDGTVTYTPDAGFGGTDHFTYYIQDDSGFQSNVSTVTVDVTKRLVDLSIIKVIVTPQAEIVVGKPLTFELKVTNNSSKGASGVVVTDALANNVGDAEIRMETETGQNVYDALTKTMNWKIDTLAPGQTVKLLLTAKLLSGGEVNNTATVTGKNEDPNLNNNTASVTTAVKGADIFVPTVFTPNGDGINDKFVILGIDRYPNSQLVIWNRWGNVVYRSNDYRNNWDGSGLNEGTYYYELICPSANNKISLKGWVQLVR